MSAGSIEAMITSRLSAREPVTVPSVCPTLSDPRQHTLRRPISCRGIGLHGGQKVSMRVVPGEAGTGITFRRTDLDVAFAARFDQVIDTRLCTVVGQPGQPSVRVATVEHVMAALAASGIDNAVVELDGPELPVLDGSSAPFLFLLDCAGRVAQTAPRSVIEVLRTVRVGDGDAFAELRPSRIRGLSLSLSIDFSAPAIGRQSFAMRLGEQAFRTELAECRTFTLLAEIEAMRAAGLARGGSLDNAVVVDGATVLNPAGLRRPDEFVRHKMLDVVGDLALAGHPIQGSFVGHCSGHGLNNRLLRALMADRSAWRLTTPQIADRQAA